MIFFFLNNAVLDRCKAFKTRSRISDLNARHAPSHLNCMEILASCNTFTYVCTTKTDESLTLFLGIKVRSCFVSFQHILGFENILRKRVNKKEKKFYDNIPLRRKLFLVMF
jgi:hypothetical protein